MIKSALCTVAAVSISLSALACESGNALSDYIAKAKMLHSNTQQAPSAQLAAQLEHQSLELVESSKKILAQVIQSKPQCADYLNQTLAAADSMLTMDLDVIERDYHQDGALPKAPSECYHAKDLLVHPATAVVLARGEYFDKSALSSIEHEIQEVLAHAQVTEAVIK